ncbi:MAG: phytoene/squalene synthase family protein [Spiribacter sp.]|jgi:phytoene synthase|nr:phytoene/squalene synthase family protein [Spiribacter sp.]
MTPREVLAKHASSFHLASRFLRPADAHDITILYALCRLIDDLADEQHGQTHQITQLMQALRERDLAVIPVAGFAEMAERRELDLAPLITLAQTAADESKTAPLLDSEAQLVDYCYGVAGTVGELMCPLIGADRQRGRPAAIALGIAMQLTNIARDVLEDAQRARRYLPGDWLNGLSPAAIAAAQPDERERVREAIARTVDLAEHYYTQAEPGLALIPARNRHAIRIAARLYRAIGLRVKAQGCRYWEGRVSLNARERAKLALVTLSGLGEKRRSTNA